MPANSKASSYGSVRATECCSFDTYLKLVKAVETSKALQMEMLKLHGDYGQNYGYILYRCNISGNARQLQFEDMPRDSAQQTQTLDILVENCGRVNYKSEESGVLNRERKGIHGNVTVDGKAIDNFLIYPLEFGAEMVKRIHWQTLPANASIPGLFRARLPLSIDVISDTFIFMKGWSKGVIFVNGFNIGRYWFVGPQQTLYVPAPLLKFGENEIVFFEHEKKGTEIVFTDIPILDINDPSDIKL